MLTIAEESTAWTGVSRPTYLGGLGFSLKWNMGWMNDTLRYMRHEPIHRKYHHDELTFSLIYAFTENFVLPLSHDEVVHGKGSLLDQMPGDLWQKFANLRLLYGYMCGHPGQEAAVHGRRVRPVERVEPRHQPAMGPAAVVESHQGLQKYVADLNQLYRREPALHEVDFDYHGFEWIDCHNYEQSTLAFLRRAKDPQRLPDRRPATSRPCRARCTAWACRSCAGTKRSSTATRPTTAAATWATARASWPNRCPGTAVPTRFPITLPPLGVVMLKPRR